MDYTQSDKRIVTSSDLEEIELGDYSSYPLVPITSFSHCLVVTSREQRSSVPSVRQRSERKVHFIDEKGEPIDQVHSSSPA